MTRRLMAVGWKEEGDAEYNVVYLPDGDTAALFLADRVSLESHDRDQQKPDQTKDDQKHDDDNG